MAGIYQSHPNNVIYLTEKYSLETKDIGKILSMIEPEKRYRYDYDNIEKLYIDYKSNKVDDSNYINNLKNVIGDKEVLIMVPGSSLNTMRDKIDKYIYKESPFVISVNFVADYPDAFCFFGNSRSYERASNKRDNRNIMITSNICSDDKGETWAYNYASLINRHYKYFENSTFMLFNLLERIGVSCISLAGFDGFNIDNKTNYSDESFQNDRYIDRFGEMNYEIRCMFEEYIRRTKERYAIRFITPSIFDCEEVDKDE